MMNLNDWQNLYETRSIRIKANQPKNIVAGLIDYSPSKTVGAPKDLIETIHAYGKAGADEIILEWFILDDLVGLQILAEEVLPHFKTEPQ